MAKETIYPNLKEKLPKGMTVTKLAELVPIDRTWLEDCMSGRVDEDGYKYKPSVHVAKRVQEITKGKIKWTEFFPDQTA
jgi:hypothetical protein